MNPRVPEALDPVRPLTIFGLSLGFQGLIYTLFAIGFLRSGTPPARPIPVHEILMRATPTAFRTVAFSAARRGQPGYDEREVDAFVDLVETEFSRLLEPSKVGVGGHELDVTNVVFYRPPRGKRGYAEDEVDTYLDVVEEELARLGKP